MLKKIIKHNNTDNYINIPFDFSSEFLGYQQEIESFTQEKTTETINEINDGEIKRFRSTSDYELNVRFYKENTGEYLNEYNAKDISYNDSLTLKPDYLNSFFILDFFDSVKSNNQTKAFTTYITKLNYNNNKKYTDSAEEYKNNNVSSYKLNDYFQIKNVNVPMWYINETPQNNFLFVLYMRLSFYNAKTGNVIVFFNDNYNNNSNNPNKMYFRFTFHKPNNTYVSRDINAIEFTQSQDYIEKFNNTFENFDNLQQNYPSGNVFNFENGSYD